MSLNTSKTVRLVNQIFNYAMESKDVVGLPIATLTFESYIITEDSNDSTMTSFFYKDDIEQLKKIWIREPHFIPLVLVYVFVFIVGVTGNCLVIIVLCLGRAGHCVTFPCLVSMAWADVLFLMVCVPHEVVIHFISHWSLSDFLCKMSGFVENLSANATVLNLILISVERYLVIAHPLSSKTLCTSRNARIALVCTWVAAVVIACPAFVVNIGFICSINNEIGFICSINNEIGFICSINYEIDFLYEDARQLEFIKVPYILFYVGVEKQARLIYAIWQLASLFVIPSCILLLCYVRVICILWLSTRQLQTLIASNRSGSCRTDHTQQMTLRNDSSPYRVRSSPNLRAGEEALNARKQVIKMLIIIIGVFFVCWGPKLIVQIMKKFHASILYTHQAFITFLVISCLPYFQSCINPLIYVIMSKNIRSSIRHILCSHRACKCCSKQHMPGSLTHELIQTNHSHAVTIVDNYRSFGNHKPTSHL